MAVKNLKFSNIRIYYVARFARKIARFCGEKKLNFLKKFFRADGVAEQDFCIRFLKPAKRAAGEYMTKHLVEINKKMPPPIKITQGFADRFYNQFKATASTLSSTSL
jgi:hypothetical protein